MDHRSSSLARVPGGDGRPEIAYLDTGPGPAGTVLLLHSLGTDHRLWAPQLGPLSERHRVVTPDSRGHGASGWTGELTIDDWVDDIARLLDRVDVDRASLVGLSMGGVQALAFALRHPDRTRALVLADTFAELDPSTARAKIEGMSVRAGDLGMPAFADTYVDETFTTEPPVAEAAIVRDALGRMSLEPYLAAVRACFGVRLDHRLHDVDAPTLVLWGDRDTKSPRPLAARLADGIPGAKLHEVPDAGHLSNLESPIAFLDLVATHLAQA